MYLTSVMAGLEFGLSTFLAGFVSLISWTGGSVVVSCASISVVVVMVGLDAISKSSPVGSFSVASLIALFSLGATVMGT